MDAALDEPRHGISTVCGVYICAGIDDSHFPSLLDESSRNTDRHVSSNAMGSAGGAGNVDTTKRSMMTAGSILDYKWAIPCQS